MQSTDYAMRNGSHAGTHGNGRAATMRRYSPASDVYENGEEILVIADLPGVGSDDVKIDLEGAKLRIEARQAASPLLEGELPAALFERVFHIPSSVDPESISAELKAGVLMVHLKKRPTARARRIDIRSS